MTRKLLFASAGIIALLVVMFALGNQPTVRADTSSEDWDLSMTDTGITANDPVCVSDTDNNIDVGECPTQTFTFTLDTSPTKPANESFFDMATQVWTTGPAGADLDGDGLAEPSGGVAQIGRLCEDSNVNPCLTLGTTGVEGSFSINTALITLNAAQNNIDDISGNRDTTVTGTSAVCGGAATFSATGVNFYLWQSSKNNANQVSIEDTDGDTLAQFVEDNYSYGQNCKLTSPATPDGMPDGIDCVPDAIPNYEAVIGLPVANMVARSFGVSKIPIVPGALYSDTPISFLVYNMVSAPEIGGYVSLNVVNWPYTAADDPFGATYDPMGATVGTCPYFSVAVKVYGITQDSDFTMPPDGVIDKNTTPQVNREVVGADGSPWAARIFKSVGEDWDGDGIANHFDRCRYDSNSGTAAQDIDGDTLTGLCENPTGMTTCVAGSQAVPGGTVYWNCEGNNPQQGGSWNTAPPWDTGQDVDQDGYLNHNSDNCPNVPDRDLGGSAAIDYQQDTDQDEVGDVCEISLASLLGWSSNASTVAGDGSGYPGQVTTNVVTSVRNGTSGTHAPGKFVDRDNLCVDPFTINAAEGVADAGRYCVGVDPVPAANNALGRQFTDSNDDAMPDLLDYPVTSAPNPIEWADVNSDSDSDGHTDACEAFMGSDPLDSSSVPAGPPTAGNCDSDATPDLTDSTPFGSLNPDADRDGCARSEEQPGAPAASNPGRTCGTSNVCYQDSAWYDFYTVPVPALKGDPSGVYDSAVTMSDVLAVLTYVGDTPAKVAYSQDRNGNTVMDGLEYDRSPSFAPDPPADAGPPDAAITMGDVLAALAQVGKSCSLGSHF